MGVQLTLVRTKDGSLRLGMEQEQGQSDVLEDIRRAIANTSRGASSLQSFAVRKARLAFYDQGTGLFVVAPDAQLEISTDNGTARTAGRSRSRRRCADRNFRPSRPCRGQREAAAETTAT